MKNQMHAIIICFGVGLIFHFTSWILTGVIGQIFNFISYALMVFATIYAIAYLVKGESKGEST